MKKTFERIPNGILNIIIFDTASINQVFRHEVKKRHLTQLMSLGVIDKIYWR